jgi:uncharacterized protein YacL
MDIGTLVVSTILIEFIVICSVNILQTGKAIYDWYKKFGLVAVLSDICSVIIGILIANYLVPNSSIFYLIMASIGVQMIHDILFYFFVVRPLPPNKNSIIDMFKSYAEENSWTILFADAAIMTSTLLVYSFLLGETNLITFLGFLGVYGITYIMYTNR